MKYARKMINKTWVSVALNVFLIAILAAVVLHKNSSVDSTQKSDGIIADTSMTFSEITYLSDSIRKVTVALYDSAVIEMVNYVNRYAEENEDSLPDFYVTSSMDTISFNKTNFFSYVELYLVADHLLRLRKSIIDGLILQIRTEEIYNMMGKANNNVSTRK